MPLRCGAAPQAPSSEMIPQQGHWTKEQWLQKLTSIDTFEQDVQKVIMNFFTVYGYEAAAAAFMDETGTIPEMPLESIGLRAKIRRAVLGGDLDAAVKFTNDIAAAILQTKPDLNFRLKQQQLLQLIQKGDAAEAIAFSQQELAPFVKLHPHLLPELEKIMSLLFFTDMKSESAQHLLGEIDKLDDTAQRIDNAVLDYFSISKESTVEMIVRNLMVTQRQVQEHMGMLRQSDSAFVGPCVVPQLVDAPSGAITNDFAVPAIPTKPYGADAGSGNIDHSEGQLASQGKPLESDDSTPDRCTASGVSDKTSDLTWSFGPGNRPSGLIMRNLSLKKIC